MVKPPPSPTLEPVPVKCSRETPKPQKPKAEAQVASGDKTSKNAKRELQFVTRIQTVEEVLQSNDEKSETPALTKPLKPRSQN